MIRNLYLTSRILIFIIFFQCGFVFNGIFEAYADKEASYKKLRLFTDVIEEIEKNYVEFIEADKLIEKAISGMVDNLDPHSSFLTPSAFNSLKDDTKGEINGIGAVITVRQGVLMVVSPIEGSPAYNAGILPGDIIFKINGVATSDMSLEDAVNRIKGPKGSSIEITIIRKGSKDPFDIKFKRDQVSLESVKYTILKKGYGYIAISNFNERTTADLTKGLNKLESGGKPLKGLIIDLRGNPGGLFDQSIQVSDLFLDTGTIVSIKGKIDDNNQSWKAHENDQKRLYPIIILINRGTASASEIVAGALKDNKRALILGTTSFGKGSVQTVKSLRDGYAIKYTIARYYTPSGISIQAQGIIPDIVLQYAPIKDEDTLKESFWLKEKDLKNHMGPKPLNKSDKKNKIKKKLNEQKKQQYSLLNIDNLMKDNQVKRALDILISQDIFNKLR